MNRRLPWGWRNIEGMRLDEDLYFALCPNLGRGVVKRVDNTWFFIKSPRENPTIIPLSFLEKVFCLYPIWKKRLKNV